MLGQDILQASSVDGGDPLAALRDLQGNASESVEKKRSTARVAVKAKVQILAGNSSQRHEPALIGVCNDVSARGCRVITMRPLMVGDIFWLVYEKDHLPVEPNFARCVRCRLMREDAFECGFAYFNPIQLPNGNQEEQDIIDMI